MELGVAINAINADEVAARYGTTDPFALLAMVIYATVLVAAVPF